MGGHYECVSRIRSKYLRYFRPGGTVLDIGCGDGAFVNLLAREGFQAFGIDINPQNVAACRQKGLNVFEAEACVYLKNHSRCYHGLICSHLIEHLPIGTVDDFLHDCRCALQNDGRILFLTPNVNYLGGCAAFWEDPTHVRPFTLSSLRKLLETNFWVAIASGYDRATPLTIRNHPLLFIIDVLRTALSLFAYGRAGAFTEIFSIARPESSFAGPEKTRR